jgi:hypothetical protein
MGEKECREKSFTVRPSGEIRTMIRGLCQEDYPNFHLENYDSQKEACRKIAVFFKAVAGG